MSYCEHCGQKKKDHCHDDDHEHEHKRKGGMSFSLSIGLLLMLFLGAGFVYSSIQNLPIGDNYRPVYSTPTTVYIQNLPVVTGGTEQVIEVYP